MPPKARRWAGWLGVFAALFVLGLAIAGRDLDNGWFYDDLHVVRSYSGAELSEGLTGTYDPDHIETPGWRPLHTPLIDAMYSLFGEDHAAHRIAMIAALAAGLTLFAAALAIVGVPPWLTVPAAALELTAKNSVYSLSWVSDGYHDFQVLAFGVALLGVALASRSRLPRYGLLGLALLFWCITLALKDQGVVLLPILIGLPVGARLFTSGGAAPGYRVLVADLKAAAGATWQRRDLRWFALSATAIAVLDLALRRVFVRSAPSHLGPDSLEHLSAQARYVLELAGRDRLPAAYVAVAAAAVILLVVWPRLAGSQTDPAAARNWRIALLAGGASLSAAAFALVSARSDLVLFPLYFYALFLCATVALAWRLLGASRFRVPLAAAGIVVAAVSVTGSVGANRDVQRAMSPWSIQTLDFNYGFLLGENAEHATIPASRRADELARLRAAGVNGYVGPTAYTTLLRAARERAVRGLPPRIVFPSEYFLGDDLPQLTSR